MPADFSMTVILAIFYLVFLGQIYVISIHYPNKMMKRIRYVHENYPPADYPKLYPGKTPEAASNSLMSRLKWIGAYCKLVAATGIGILAYMLGSGYEPAFKGGDEIFVMLYFFLQATPFLYLAVKEYQQFSNMHEGYKSAVRSADLRPRRLFDFVHPSYLFAAIAMFVVWLVFYIWQAGDIAAWGGETYATLVFITGMHMVYGFVIAQHLHGKKIDPYQARDDQMRTIGVTINILVISSFMISLFLLLTQMADEFAFEVFDPVMTSFYLQLCLILGVGQTFRTVKIENVDFEVYRADPPVA